MIAILELKLIFLNRKCFSFRMKTDKHIITLLLRNKLSRYIVNIYNVSKLFLFTVVLEHNLSNQKSLQKELRLYSFWYYG